ncbi:DTW domain-containing protein [Undibacterium piscinae]|uniref:tRNA-uridine aminocarboxypropyltransferase n=1 Tax=Undibacterium piscinae TaxID=2495591 RepID=A0A6M4A3B7_9BURK|nr:DTW domain-containing protein [Undibacterium piscinae]
MDQPKNHVAQRQICPRCLRPERSCICHWIVKLESLVELIVLQHPLEVHQAKGSARLLHLSVSGSQLQIGESFEPDVLRELLMEDGKTNLLLYPDNPAERHIIPAPPVLTADQLSVPGQLRLIVLDGTWRKSRKMLYQNPLLQQLPRLALSDMPASHYRIRKAHKPDQLSTLEASCYALMQLESNGEKYQPLLDAFDGFITQQLSLNGALRPAE